MARRKSTNENEMVDFLDVKENIEEVNIATQSREDMTGYAIYAARYRAIPDYIDGLKPVIRRIIWCAGHDFKGQGMIKTANIMGQVVRKYNPHGDASVKMAIRNMINDFSTKYPTMDGEGSWGQKTNPYPAAERYTACKISQFAVDVFLQDIYDDPRATDWQNNYDNKYKEPKYLPAKIPTMLILGQVGIAVGMKNSIPSHNLGDVIDVAIALIKNPRAKFCLIPDECMPCEIIETDFQKICDTGSGTYIAQGIIEIGEYNKHPALFVKSLPDFTFYDSIKESIIKIVEEKKMPYIEDLVSKSKVDKSTGKTYMDEVIILKKGADPYFVKEFLYANTGIRQTRQVKMIAIQNNHLKTMNYREYLLDFINFRRMTVFRKKNAELQNYETAIHERELYLKAMTSGHIDHIIDMIKKQNTTDDSELIEFLIKKLRVTSRQAKFLLDTDIRKLSKGYLHRYQEQIKQFTAKKNEIKALLLDPKAIDNYIINEMLMIKKKYNNPHMCKIISKAESKGIAPGTFKLVFTKKNFIRKLGEHENITSMGNDEVNFVVTVENTQDILIFTTMGKVFKLPVSKIPLYAKGSNGIDVRILNKYITSNIVCAASTDTIDRLIKGKKFKSYIFIVTRKGFIKKMDLDDIVNAVPSGIIYSKLDEGDYVKDIIFGPDKLDLLVYSGNKVLRMSPKQVPYLKRSTKGNRVSTASSEIDGMNFVIPGANELVIVTANGFVNKIPLEFVPMSTRGKAGCKVIKLGKATKSHPEDKIISIWPCSENNSIVVTEPRSVKTVPVKDIPQGTTVSSGVEMFTGPKRIVLQ